MRQERATANLALATLAFGLSFAVWSLISPLAPQFQNSFGLSDTQTSLLIALPVLLGSLARIPMGMLTDRFGGRVVFSGLMAFSILPVVFLALSSSFWMMLVGGFWLGMAGSSFAVGIPFVSRWYSAGKQGTALGIYGAGNIGTALAAYSVPWIAGQFGWQYAFWVFVPILAAASVLFWLMAADAPNAPRPRSLSESLQVIRRERLSWAFSFFYFLTFGGFVAFSIYLPKLLVDWFAFDKIDAGMRTAGFVVLATAARPLGGYLADRIGGARLLAWVFGLAPLLALVLAWQALGPTIVPSTIAFLGIALLLGLGNGAVFKLVAQYFPRNTGVVTGVVGASGGLGGFFPPIVMGVVRDLVGSYAPALVLLALFLLAALALNFSVLVRGASSLAIDEGEEKSESSPERDARSRRSKSYKRSAA